jgi:Holliday junction resolvase-like predicted endonuclease
MASIIIETLTVPFEKNLLDLWKDRSPEIVPLFMLEWEGPGISNGYGFGEWMAEKYYRNKGYNVFNNNFDLISKRSKYLQFNKMIRSLIDDGQYNKFSEVIKFNSKSGYKVENLDLFVFNEKEYFFVEVKKGSDKLREPQMRFMYFAKRILDIESKLIYFCDKSVEKKVENITYNFEIKTSDD